MNADCQHPNTAGMHGLVEFIWLDFIVRVGDIFNNYQCNLPEKANVYAPLQKKTKQLFTTALKMEHASRSRYMHAYAECCLCAEQRTGFITSSCCQNLPMYTNVSNLLFNKCSKQKKKPKQTAN